jgi:hypothetical protein
MDYASGYSSSFCQILGLAPGYDIIKENWTWDKEFGMLRRII